MGVLAIGERMGKMTVSKVIARIISPERFLQFFRFCLVGSSGVVVDMGVLFLLADPRVLGWNLIASKVCAAEIALLNNFAWNELWTFKERARKNRGGKNVLRRLIFFNAICGAGIFLAAASLNVFHSVLAWNIYLSNLFAIGIVTIWNFVLNAWLNWRASNIEKLE
jgi:dolichol-phosphate mannosyltransferase